MKTKGQVFSRFQEFKALVENQTGKKIRVSRSDNGGEYTSKKFMEFYAREGIRRELTVPYNPQQNGVAERKNRAIVGAARAMLHDQGLPLFLWAEACYTAVYLQNRSPHKAVGSMTPEEAFSGKKPETPNPQAEIRSQDRSNLLEPKWLFRIPIGTFNESIHRSF
jgi:hypothetical protein